MGFAATLALARPFTVDDDVSISRFDFYAGYVSGPPSGGQVIKVSPDGRYFAIVTERGLIDRNMPEDTIWLFRIADIWRFLQHDSLADAAPVSLVRMTGNKDGPIIGQAKWLPDSSGIAFTALKKSERYTFNQLFAVNIHTKSLRPLTPIDQNVEDFDVKGVNDYIYVARAPTVIIEGGDSSEAALVLTGKSLYQALFPREKPLAPFDDGGLWEVANGERRRVMDEKEYQVPIFGAPVTGLALSPDGTLAVAVLRAEPREGWTRYQSRPGAEAYYDPTSTFAYHLIDLKKGSKKLLVDAPSGEARRWETSHPEMKARWSADGESLVISNTFLPLDASNPGTIEERESHPYVAVLRFNSRAPSAIQPVKAAAVNGGYFIDDLRFVNNYTVAVHYDRMYYSRRGPSSEVFHQGGDGVWKTIPGAEDPWAASLPVTVEVREGINQPPQIIGANKADGQFHVVWDPNPRLKDIELGEAEVIHGKDSTGYEWEAGLVKPVSYEPGKRYPVVIQTHGFTKNQFLTNGIYSTAFAARALAAAGIMVAQAPQHPPFDVPQEGPNQVATFQSIVKTLVDRGLADSARVGVIGFSRTLYHVLYVMALGELPLAAASATDGVNFGYFEYLLDAEVASEADKINGGTPLDEAGMRNWRARSPEFNMEKVKTPLLLVQPGLGAVLADWGPYAVLRSIHKPVDLILIPRGTHPLTNPRERIECEAINVDWFRFWLQGYEDPSTEKADQYRRWEKLCDLQVDQNPKQPAFCVRSKAH